MTMSVSAGGPVRSVDRHEPALGADEVTPSALLPAPRVALDGMGELFRLFAEQNRVDARSARTDMTGKMHEKEAARDAQKAALAEAERLQNEPRGFFDAMGIGTLVGVATASPLLVMADVSMHMAKLTPDLLRDFEKDNADSIELATKLYCTVGNAAALKDGLVSPEAYRAAIALGGLLVAETEVLGEEASAWVGTAMIVNGSVDRGAAAMVVIADKDNAVGEKIREIDRDSLEYTKWIAVAGMAVAAGGAIVASAGTATMPVVLIGVALSAGGFFVQETKALDPVLGKDASLWIGGGMMFAGAALTGGGAAAAQATTVSQALTMTGTAIEGGSQVHAGMHQVENAAIVHEVDERHISAQEYANDAQRIQRMVDEIIDGLREDAKSLRRITATVQAINETKSETQLISIGVRA